ncbi:nicotinate-nucleotide adenylyltransferase [Biformimicrobium ophioploci]|uniref:Probable nicotinate-nucleotide adenylyltransferase n=1 Tax=Biformimicrobium ophioploci TaxID=3036711 RepID=A0ABQ6LWK0_9GAMM|nr:nicotinate-nucleotide adenylyltransferase [Microbulbifer sp. NKW57]GMG86449.1 nicotinate-nucleotide adenylyltransferase [Microbulbifer sp. NKW57]
MTAASNGPIGIFGGTFNPVHFGHLRMALELRETLDFDEMRLLPCSLPPHKEEPGVSAQHRLEMLRLATEQCPGLAVDDRELRRAGPSYSYDTLAEIRAELGPARPLVFCMGLDSLVKLDSWYRWQELLQLTHIVAVSRPGWRLPAEGAVAELIVQAAGSAAQLAAEPAGRLLVLEQTLLPISSTRIRALVREGRSPRYLLPERVWQYISEQRLYKAP